MANILKQSTEIKVRIGPFVDATDGVTPEHGVALGTADQAEALKANGAATADISAATWAAVTGADGWYDLTLTTSHTDTVGELVIVVQDSSVCLPVFARFQVVEEAVYDAMYGASAAGPLQSTTAGRKLDVTATGAAGIDWGNVENASTAVDLSATDIQLCDTVTTNTDMRGTDSAYTGTPPTAAAIADAVWDEAKADHTGATTFGDLATDLDAVLADTADMQPKLGTPAGADMSADIAAVKSQTAAIETDTQDIQSRLPSALNNGAIPADIQRINDVEITGDGSATPFDVP